MKPDTRPSPGSAKARAIGCTCPVIDNGHGRGYMGQSGVFVIDATCKVHGSAATPRDDDDEA